MTLCKQAGLADPSAQLYMFFYYLGPLGIFLTLLDRNHTWPPRGVVSKACGIAVFDIASQALNYTGAGLAGPTLFAIIYSSVTIWTAVWSRIFLRRTLTLGQWGAVLLVFLGLAITATDSIRMGPEVARGTVMVVFGSLMHGAAYVMSEAIMTVTTEQLSVRQNVGIQGTVACVALGLWQVVFTWPRYDALIGQPARDTGTTLATAAAIMFAFTVANLAHSVTFSHTLKYYPGGAVSAGVMKGLQAVLVFAAAHILFCGRVSGDEMCFSTIKLLSLVVVAGGVALFGYLTELVHTRGYATLESAEDEEGLETIVV